MASTMTRRRNRFVLFGLAAVLSACSTGPDRLTVDGTWEGTALLPNAYTTTLTLLQSGATITGTLDIAGVLDQAFVGTLDESTRVLQWTVFDGCEHWTGTFTVDADGTGMAGPVTGDLSACAPPGTNISGTITLSKQ